MKRSMCGVQLKDACSVDLVLMLGLSKTIDQLAMANNVHWYGHVLRKKDGHVLRRTLDFEFYGQSKKEKQNWTWRR